LPAGVIGRDVECGSGTASNVSRLCRELKLEAFCSSGTDPDEFLRYKSYLDATHATANDKPIILPAWLTKASQTESIIPELEDLGTDIPGIVIKLLGLASTKTQG